MIFQFNTITENLDLSDNYVEGEGAVHIARMLKENAFITSLVSKQSVSFCFQLQFQSSDRVFFFVFF